jgi:hypothetical protein
MREAASAYIGGDMRRYFALIPTTDDYTLMSPFDGEVPASRRPRSPTWKLAHRHADALAHPIDLDHLAVLARG